MNLYLLRCAHAWYQKIRAMQYVKLTVPQHIYEQLGLHPNKTLVLKRSENIGGINTHGNNVSTTEIAETSSHCDEPELTAPDIDACEENESFLQKQDDISQSTHRNPGYSGSRVVRTTFSRTCEKCKQKYLTPSSYFDHLDGCVFIHHNEKSSSPDSPSYLNMIPEAFHALGYDTPEQNKSSQILANGKDAESGQDSSDSNMIPEALHALCYDTLVLPVPENNDIAEENESSPQNHNRSSRVFLDSRKTNADALRLKYLNRKAEFPRPCPLCEKMLYARTSYYQHRKVCLLKRRVSNIPKKKVPKPSVSHLTPSELRVLGYDIPVSSGHEINDTTAGGRGNESSLQMHGGTSEAGVLNSSDSDDGFENMGFKYPRPCPLCDKMCDSSYMYFKHRRRCRDVEIPENSSVIRYYDYGSSSDSSDHLDLTPEELTALGGDEPSVSAEPAVDVKKANQPSTEAFQALKTSARRFKKWKEKLYPRVCTRCGRKYTSKESFCNHKKRCARYVAEGEKRLNKTENLDGTPNRWICSFCLRSYGTKFNFRRHFKSCGHTRGTLTKRVRIGDYILPQSARIYREQRQDTLISGAADKEDKPVKWVPVTTKPTSALKYFVANKNQS